MSEPTEEIGKLKRGFIWSTAALVAFYLLLAWPAVVTGTMDTWSSLFVMSVAGMCFLYFYAKRKAASANDDNDDNS